MNNAHIISNTLENDAQIDLAPLYTSRSVKLSEKIEAIQHIKESNYWKILEEFFTDELDSLNKKLLSEKDVTEIFRLQGQIQWANRFADLSTLAEKLKVELSAVKSKIHAK